MFNIFVTLFENLNNYKNIWKLLINASFLQNLYLIKLIFNTILKILNYKLKNNK